MSNLGLFFKLLIIFFGSYEDTHASRSLTTKYSTIPTTTIPTTIIPATIIPATIIPATIIPATIIPATIISARMATIPTITTATTITTIPTINTTIQAITTTKMSETTTVQSTLISAMIITRFPPLTTLSIPLLTTVPTRTSTTVTDLMTPNKHASLTKKNSRPVTSRKTETFLTDTQVTKILKPGTLKTTSRTTSATTLVTKSATASAMTASATTSSTVLGTNITEPTKSATTTKKKATKPEIKPVKTQSTAHFPTLTSQSLTSPISTPSTILASTISSLKYTTTNTPTTSLLIDTNEKDSETKDFVVGKNLMIKKMGEIKRNKKFRNDVMVIEIFVVVDYSCYLKWLEFSSGREEKALYNLRFYISNLIKRVKNKFSSISVSSYRYEVKLIGYHIIKISDDSSFLKSASVKKILKPEKSLKTFSDWLQEGKHNFPKYDIAIGLTNHKLEKYHGMSYIGTACTTKGAALVSEEGLMATVDTAVHEIGHLLGSYHDGSNNECSSRNNYIMTPIHLTTSHNNFDTFSYCSLRYFQRYIELLDSNNRNCLRHHSGYDKIEQRLLNIPAGQYFKLKQQCQLVYGLKSFYCSTGADTHENICREIFCFNPNTSSCSRTPTLKALEGTTCGDKMWCFKEICVSHPSAPATHRKDCLYGDLSERVENTAVNSSCSFLKNKRSKCYIPQLEKICCQTCSLLAQPSSPDCKYGDKLEGCARMPNPKNLCNFSKVKQGCCQYCSSFTKASTSIQPRNHQIIQSYQKEN